MSLLHSVNLTHLGMEAAATEYVLDVYRGDLEHDDAPGNKWHKLQYHLAEAKKRKAKVVATFGGPFSNHLHAFGNTLEHLPFKAVAVIRGELHPILTPTLRDMALRGVELWPTSRSDYRLGQLSWVANEINRNNEKVYWIPEGGGGLLGVLGCRDWAENIARFAGQYDAWVISSGTGTTAAGFLACHDTPKLHVFSALKGSQTQCQEIHSQALNALLTNRGSGLDNSGLNNKAIAERLTDKLHFHSDSHEGGYAKSSPALKEFLREFAVSNADCCLDPVYTSKSMLAVVRAMRSGEWPYQRTLFIHTGGLQGWRGFSAQNNPFKVF